MKKPGLVSFLGIRLFAVAILACNRPTPATQNTSTGTGNSSMSPSRSPEELVRYTIYRRAVEAVIWGTPAVNFDRMYQAMVHDAKAGEGSNKIVYWSRLFNWKNQTLTPNPDSIYFMPFFDTKNVGPVVLEVPPAEGGSITGSIDDCWQTAIADVGPAGTDQGKGGKYLLLPPDYKGKIPSGYIPLETVNYQALLGWPSRPENGASPECCLHGSTPLPATATEPNRTTWWPSRSSSTTFRTDGICGPLQG